MSVYSFGSGTVGQLGIAGSNEALDPSVVTGLKGKRIARVRCGEQTSMAISELGDVWMWGRGREGQLAQGDVNSCTSVSNRNAPHHHKTPASPSTSPPNGTSAMSVSPPLTHHLYSSSASIASSTSSSRSLSSRCNSALPVRVEGLRHERIVDGSCGSQHCIAISDTGRVYTWGKLHRGVYHHITLATQCRYHVAVAD
jgi:regulator of chromosome condensation